MVAGGDDDVKIVVKRSGGFAAIPLRGELDTAGRADAGRWHELVRRARLRSAPPHRPQPDRFVYTIDVDGEEVTIGEADLTALQQDLVDSVLAEP